MPLHYEKFLKHQQEENHLTKKEAENLWSQYVESDRERDHLGPEHSKLRIYTPVEDYICREDVSGYSKEQLSGTKPKTNASASASALDLAISPVGCSSERRRRFGRRLAAFNFADGFGILAETVSTTAIAVWIATNSCGEASSSADADKSRRSSLVCRPMPTHEPCDTRLVTWCRSSTWSRSAGKCAVSGPAWSSVAEDAVRVVVSTCTWFR